MAEIRMQHFNWMKKHVGGKGRVVSVGREYSLSYVGLEPPTFMHTAEGVPANLLLRAGDEFKVVRSEGEYCWIVVTNRVSEANSATGEQGMVGNVYVGFVVRTTQVAAAEGASSTIAVSEVVFETDGAFVAPTDDAAKAYVACKSGVNFADPTAPAEVKLLKIA